MEVSQFSSMKSLRFPRGNLLELLWEILQNSLKNLPEFPCEILQISSVKSFRILLVNLLGLLWENFQISSGNSFMFPLRNCLAFFWEIPQFSSRKYSRHLFYLLGVFYEIVQIFSGNLLDFLRKRWNFFGKCPRSAFLARGALFGIKLLCGAPVFQHHSVQNLDFLHDPIIPTKSKLYFSGTFAVGD